MTSPITADSPNRGPRPFGFGGPPTGPVDTIGLEGSKLLLSIRMHQPWLFPTQNDSNKSNNNNNNEESGNEVPDEVAGIHPGLFAAIDNSCQHILSHHQGKKLCVVFDGLLLPMVLEEKGLSEDVIMATAWHLTELRHEVIFAPYLACQQLSALRHAQHVQVAWQGAPPTIPAKLVSWNEEGLRAPNVHGFTPMLQLNPHVAPHFTPGTLMQSQADAMSGRAIQGQNTPPSETTKHIMDHFSLLDAPFASPMLALIHSAGIISPKLARALARRTVDNDGVARDRTAERALYTFMSLLLPLRAQIVHQLIADVPVANGQQLSLKWDDSSANATPPLIELDGWNLRELVGRNNGPRDGTVHTDFLEPWGVSDVLRFEKQAVSDAPARQQPVTVWALVPTVILRALDLMGYFTHAQEEQDMAQPTTESSSCSIYGNALKAFQDAPELGEAAVLFIELVRTNAFNLLRPRDPSEIAAAAANAKGAASSSSDALDKQQQQQQQQQQQMDDEDDEEDIVLNSPEDIAVKIACLVPVNTIMDMSRFPGGGVDEAAEKAAADAESAAAAAAAAEGAADSKDTAAKAPKKRIIPPTLSSAAAEVLATQRPFMKAAQAHTRSLRMLVEASAGNIVLRDFVLFTQHRPQDADLPHNNADLLTSLPAALPFKMPPSQRSLFFYMAAAECGGDAEKMIEKFGMQDYKEHVVADLERLKAFVSRAVNARMHLAVKDDDVGLSPEVIERIEPALKILCEKLGLANN